MGDYQEVIRLQKEQLKISQKNEKEKLYSGLIALVLVVTPVAAIFAGPFCLLIPVLAVAVYWTNVRKMNKELHGRGEASQASNLMNEITQLSNLHKEGHLTSEEYQAGKNKILNGKEDPINFPVAPQHKEVFIDDQGYRYIYSSKADKWYTFTEEDEELLKSKAAKTDGYNIKQILGSLFIIVLIAGVAVRLLDNIPEDDQAPVVISSQLKQSDSSITKEVDKKADITKPREKVATLVTDKQTFKNPGLACFNKSDIEALTEAAVANDTERFQQLWAVAVVTERCKSYKTGDQVIVYERSFWNGIAKVRFQGDARLYWISYNENTFLK